MADPNKIRKRAVRSIELGKAKLEKERRNRSSHIEVKTLNKKTGSVTISKRKRSKNIWQSEDDHRLVYEDARNLILKHAYEESLDPAFQKMYRELIPENQGFKDLNRLRLQPLLKGSLDDRRLASRLLCSEINGGNWESWPQKALDFRHPKTVEHLLKAVRREEDQKVILKLLTILGFMYASFLKDLRIFPVLFPFFESENKAVRQRAIWVMSSMPNLEKWKPIEQILTAKESQPITMAALGHFQFDAKPRVSIKNRFRPIIWILLQRKLNIQVKQSAFSALYNLLDSNKFEQFKTMTADSPKLLKEFKPWAQSNENLEVPTELTPFFE